MILADKTKPNVMEYLFNEDDGTSVYVMYLNGRPAFYAYAHKDVMDIPIKVSKPQTDAERIPTGTRAYLIEDMTRIAGPSVQQALIPNIPWILMELYVPKD